MNYLALTGVETTLISILAAVWAIILTLFALALYVRHAAFGSRCDKNPLLKYFSAEDFGLSAETVELLKSHDGSLRAVIYKKPEVPAREKLIIFCHGMGPGHVAYTTEIAYFCNLGYTVLAPDYYGCNLSDGKKISDFAFGRLTDGCAVEYARLALPQFEEIFLVGHSWGGWTAICAGFEKEVDKIVAISAPDRADRAILDAAAGRLPKFLIVLLRPFVRLTCGDKSAAKLARQCACPVMLVQGDSDRVVPPKNAVYYKASGSHIQKLLVAGRGHNPYNTAAAEAELSRLSAALASFAKTNDKQFFENFDFSAATEEDGAVMGEIARFLEVDDKNN